jgi:fatty acid desaturase
MKANQVLSHIFLAICSYNLVAFGFIQIDIWGTTPLWCMCVVIGTFMLGFQVRSVLARGEVK